jgi:hypothetical protein
MTAPRRAKSWNKERRRLVRAIAEVLIVGEPTLFRWEAWCRYKLRTGLCMQGMGWARSDATAADVVERAFDLLNVERPPWAWGQIEHTWESPGTRVEYTHCLQCGSRLPEDRMKFCGKVCGSQFRHALHVEDFHDRERALAYLRARRDRAEPKECQRCGTWFRPAKATQMFCSRQCSGGRSVKEKMNGHHHPWKTGAAAANGAGISLAKAATPDECSAPLNANIATTTPTSRASEPRPAPS